MEKIYSKVCRSNTVPFTVPSIIPQGNVESLDLIDLMLQFNPDFRITAEEALEHPFLAAFHTPDGEFVYAEKDANDSEEGTKLDDNLLVRVHDYRDAIYGGMLGHPRVVERLREALVARKERALASVGSEGQEESPSAMATVGLVEPVLVTASQRRAELRWALDETHNGRFDPVLK
ncbi:hypothetical protein FOZ60_004766 [Perkinsus olseni]|uniref:Mitogen-activated protein kinase n=1 Tax=Perkinsus olseni TaxID=32597 RepID=A0A7J6NSG4_PEROL|nr:hypothetical protein FOZ60_004766 [Perkinsus olseni]